MAVERFPVEAGHILCFARAIGDANPAYYGALTGADEVPAPPTFVQSGVHFEPDWVLRPKAGEPWFGSGRDASGVVKRSDDHGGGTALHAEQHFEYHQPIRAGDVLTASARQGQPWEKKGRRGGRLLFTESVTEYRNGAGELVVSTRTIGVVTEKVVDKELAQ